MITPTDPESIPAGDDASSKETFVATERDYNTVFERLVDANDEEQLIGLVAYSVYKSSKRTWVREYRRRSGRYPSPDEYRTHADAQTDEQMNNYRSRAADIVGSYASALVDQQRPAILQEALRGGFWRGVGASVVASFIFAVFLALLGLLAWVNGWTIPIPLEVVPPIVDGS